MTRALYGLTDWTDARINRARYALFAAFMVAPLLAVVHSWLWLAAFYVCFLALAKLMPDQRHHRFRTLDELKSFVGGLQ